MAYNGSGVFSVLYSWVARAALPENILAAKMDEQHTDFATGLSTAITKDGQTTITANLPMATFRHTGVGNATARDQYASAAQVQDGGLIYGGTSSGTNTVTFNLTPTLTAYTTGLLVRFKAGGTNTGAVTVNINSLGAKDVKKNVSTALAASDILVNQIVTIAYDGTNFQMI